MLLQGSFIRELGISSGGGKKSQPSWFAQYQSICRRSGMSDWSAKFYGCQEWRGADSQAHGKGWLQAVVLSC
jgi:hypothetical protein